MTGHKFDKGGIIDTPALYGGPEGPEEVVCGPPHPGILAIPETAEGTPNWVTDYLAYIETHKFSGHMPIPIVVTGQPEYVDVSDDLALEHIGDDQT